MSAERLPSRKVDVGDDPLSSLTPPGTPTAVAQTATRTPLDNDNLIKLILLCRLTVAGDDFTSFSADAHSLVALFPVTSFAVDDLVRVTGWKSHQRVWVLGVMASEGAEQRVYGTLEQMLIKGLYAAPWRATFRLFCSLASMSWPKFRGKEDDLGATDALEEVAEISTADTESKGRMWKIGLATVGGGALLLLTGGLAAPLVGMAVGTTFAAAGAGSAAVGAAVATMIVTKGALTAAGAIIAARGMDRRTAGLEEFAFLTVRPRGCCLMLNVGGWLHSEEEIATEWGVLPDGQQAVLRWETRVQLELGEAFNNFIKTTISQSIGLEVLKRAILGAATLPIQILAMVTLVDNPWQMAQNRADKAGILLAQILGNRDIQTRPVSLMAYSVGCRVVFTCLKELKRMNRPDVVDSVYFFGAAVTTEDLSAWEDVRSVVSGNFVNVYSAGDWVLGFLFRAINLTSAVAGLGPVNCAGVRNVDLADIVGSVTTLSSTGHMSYKKHLPIILDWMLRND